MTSTDRLRVASDARDRILDHAREGAARTPPVEVCGVLVGRRGPPDRVTGARRVANVADRPRSRYELDPAATVAAIDAAEAAGEAVVGFYHSHPETDAVPSATDRARATWTGYVYAIAAPPATLRAYRLADDGFEELPVRSPDSRA